MIRSYRVLMGGCKELVREGPLVVGRVQPDPATAALIVATDSSLGEQVTFMVDTGASDSFVDVRVAQKLRLRCVGKTLVYTIGGPAECPLYAATIVLPMSLDTGEAMSRQKGPYEMTAMPFELAGVIGEQSGLVRSGLLGRNFLSYFQLLYDGPEGKFGLRTTHEWSMDY